MNREQKKAKIKQVRETYLRFRDEKWAIARKEADRVRILAERKHAKKLKEAQDEFTSILDWIK